MIKGVFRDYAIYLGEGCAIAINMKNQEVFTGDIYEVASKVDEVYSSDLTKICACGKLKKIMV